MPKLSVQQFAELAGVSRQHINTIVNRGDLVRGSDKKMDLDIRANFQYLLDRGVSLDDMKPPEKKPHGKKKPKPKPKKPTKRPPPADITGVDAEAVLSQISNLDILKMTSADVAKVARMESAAKTRVEREHKRGLLIERNVVQTVFGKLYQIDTNEFRTMGAKLAAPMAEIFGCDDPEKILEAEKRIDDEVLKIMAHVKRVFNDFLIKAGSERVK